MPTQVRELALPYRRGSDLLALAFGTTVTMWTLGYIGRFPGVNAPAWLLMVLLLACLLGCGWASNRLAGRGPAGSLRVGLLVGVLNLLILGGLLASGDQTNRLVPSALWWLPGSLLVAGGLSLLGTVLGRRLRGGAPGGGEEANGAGSPLARHGLPAFAAVTAAATFLLLIAGGIVTGNQAGLAVVDWPNSYGYNMFLYPLSRMTGGIYYEHVHRLLGSLVGLSTVVLAVHLWRVEDRRWLRRLGLLAVILVVAQGVLGGLRVTGHFTLSDDPDVTRPNLALAVIHGIAGQLFFALMVAITAVTTRLWREAPVLARAAAPEQARPAAATGALDRRLAAWLLGVLILQLGLGAVLRHTDGGLHAHITVAVLALCLGVVLGSRLVLRHAGRPALRRLGQLLLHGVIAQLIVGFAALFARNLVTGEGQPHPAGVAITTIHQALGALLLAGAVLSVLWTRRLLRTEVL
jgi:cytochrome c oxidase assembly protein subunit 15